MIPNERNSEPNRGQVGIGTLIVFIAMVLVAAIAAGVLINTAGFLQTQAEDTGTSSTEQVADNLNVITEVGNVSANDTVNELRVGVQPSAGADDINLAELTIQYVSDEDFANIVVGNDSTADEPAEGDTDPSNIELTNDSKLPSDESTTEYLIDVITAENEDDVVMTDSSDRYELVIPLTINASSYDADNKFDQDGIGELKEGSQVELTITTDVGSQTVAFLQVPDSLSGDEADSTVNL
jgi:flagellin FlaB